ncbi:maltase 1-like [Agrilus planipennis]|uniref:alpha-glucosidase n=1 Tax=Agrilus planipennis TaxID=224129 RepID=A0A1W4W746_AGRPL|nr:maltase 1-like [Agrilus planipennis]
MNALKTVILFTALLQSLIEAVIVYNGSSTAKDDWWKYATFYQVYPRSFKDSDGDGLGDIKGITSQLQYLVDAGVNAAWFSPIFISPGIDAGYDISDFRDIDPNFGTMSDFDELLDQAHQLGLKIILDFVPNHTSDQHAWFQLSKNRTAGYEDYYVWMDGANSTTPPNNWRGMFGSSAWTFVPERGQYYYHLFTAQQPELNFRNPRVVQEMKDILTFWLDKGIDGFRADAVPYIFETFPTDPGTPETYNPNAQRSAIQDQPESLDMVYQWRAVLDDYNRRNGGNTRVFITEGYTNITATMPYYGNDTVDGAHFTFNFFLITNTTSNSTASEVVRVITAWFQNMPSRYVANWVLGNHDRPRVATRLGVENVDGYNMLISLLPGVVNSYYGEEIGMENGVVTWEQGQDPRACGGPRENFLTEGRDFERTPFHWNSSVNAGFSTANSTWLPVSAKYITNNLELQSRDGVKSHFHVYQGLMKLRQEDTIIFGNLNIEALDTYVFAFTRELAGNDTYVFLFNKGNYSSTVSLSSFTSLSNDIRVVLSSTDSFRNEGDFLPKSRIYLDAHEAIVAKSRPNNLIHC